MLLLLATMLQPLSSSCSLKGLWQRHGWMGSVKNMCRCGLFMQLQPVISCHLISYHVIAYHITSSHIIAYHITSHHSTSHHLISSHIVSYHTLSYHIIPHNLISYHIISYHIISYPILSYHIISYLIILYHIISYHTTQSHITRRHIIPYHAISILGKGSSPSGSSHGLEAMAARKADSPQWRSVQSSLDMVWEMLPLLMFVILVFCPYDYCEYVS